MPKLMLNDYNLLICKTKATKVRHHMEWTQVNAENIIESCKWFSKCIDKIPFFFQFGDCKPKPLYQQQ